MDKKASFFDFVMSWDEALNSIKELNHSELYGYYDWRVPNIVELESLRDMRRHSPALPVDHLFTDVQDFYWSSTTSMYDTSYAWVLYMIDGAVGVGHKPLSGFYLWPVRGNKITII